MNGTNIIKLEIEGNPFIGAFGVATDKFAIVTQNISKGKEQMLRDALGVEIVKATIDNSHLVGIYVACNSSGILLPVTSEHSEIERIKEQIKGMEVEVLKTDMNALRNNILANDRIAVLNPEYTQKEEKMIADVLRVETVRRDIGGFNTVGANNILTNKGAVLNNRVNEDEKKELEELFKVEAEQSTANLGSLAIGLSVLANSSGVAVGGKTTGFELARITNALNL
ncbi:MAG: translation initiation factor IF-6 [Candidatus Micrarchaeota archaeon]|nr:translation initiation factor IF-6 [Candidatus Micrarchaeota archaeon]MDE1848331.1 translation initiation factor IF-6 [Candidatus Micrarchaeota archaeon]MDE1864920.1 translation initiation factor IF-6 [Candidatus Micrarchaeota archaeon]